MAGRGTLIVIGGGAAGFFCAVNAARLRPGLQVIILEKSSKCLSKVRISGGGRCNLTHACFEIPEMIRRYPRGGSFLRKAFHRFFTTETIAWFEERGVILKTEKDGRMFPISDSSQSVIDCLTREAMQYKVDIRLNHDVQSLSREGEKFLVTCAGKPALSADYICVAAGGYPKSFMFDWLRQTRHSIEPPVPSLFSFNLDKQSAAGEITRLMGVAVDPVKAKILGTPLEQEGPLLITHWGFSGPAILKLSAWAARELRQAEYRFIVQVNWLPGLHEQALREQFMDCRQQLSAQKIRSRSPFALPARLWDFICEQSGVTPGTRWAELTSAVQHRLLRNLLQYECPVKGKTTFKEEFVTAGGISLSEVDAQTMMSRKMNGLYFAGEVLDVDGITGGYNFQHAWTSGWIAANAIAAAS